MIISWLDAKEAKVFAAELARFVLTELERAQALKQVRFTRKAEKALAAASARVRGFKASHRLNFYQRAQLSNAFLWTLKDGGCEADYAQELTQWLTMQL